MVKHSPKILTHEEKTTTTNDLAVDSRNAMRPSQNAFIQFFPKLCKCMQKKSCKWCTQGLGGIWGGGGERGEKKLSEKDYCSCWAKLSRTRVLRRIWAGMELNVICVLYVCYRCVLFCGPKSTERLCLVMVMQWTSSVCGSILQWLKSLISLVSPWSLWSVWSHWWAISLISKSLISLVSHWSHCLILNLIGQSQIWLVNP